MEDRERGILDRQNNRHASVQIEIADIARWLTVDWKRCEAMLRTHKWQLANTATCAGIETRIEMMRQAGLPEMKVISASTIEQLGRIPRSNEGHAINAIDAVRKHGADDSNYCKAAFVMFSHRWKRPLWSEKLSKNVDWGSDEHFNARDGGDYIGDPDDDKHSKARSLINWVKWFKQEVSTIGHFGTQSGAFQSCSVSPHTEEVYFWIDWPCIDQTNPAPGVAALPAYVSTCHAICAAWNAEYASRAWCRVELITAQAFMKNGDRIFVCEETTTPLLHGSVQKEKVQILHPLDGEITNEADRKVVERLQEAAFDSKAFSCSMLCFTEVTTSARNCLLEGCFCFGCCGLDYMERARIPGQTKMLKMTPYRRGSVAPTSQAMARDIIKAQEVKTEVEKKIREKTREYTRQKTRERARGSGNGEMIDLSFHARAQQIIEAAEFIPQVVVPSGVRAAQVIIPAGVTGGSPFTVCTPSGRQVLQLVCPIDNRTGDTITIDIPVPSTSQTLNAPHVV